MTESASAILLRIDAGIATLTLNRPQVRNAIDDAMRGEMIEALEAVAADPAVKALVVTGTGTAFCAGGDVRGMQNRLAAPAEEVAINGWRRQARTHRAVTLLHLMPKPVIAALNGAAAGLGADVALACDLILAGESAHLTMSFIARGLIPDGGGMYFLPRRVGLARAKELVFSGRRVGAAEALSIGLVDRLVPDAELAAAAQAWAAELGAGSAAALALAKATLDRSLESSFEQVLAIGSQSQAICYTTAEHRASVAAFLGEVDKGMSALDALLRPRSVAVVGASSDLAKTGGRPVGYLLRHGFAGAVWPVNPRATEIAGLPCFADVASLPGAPDVGIVLVAPERAEQAVRDLAARGCQAAIVLAGGYGESGADGAARQAALKRAAGGMRLLGPNTIGLVNLTDGIVLSASGALEFEDLPTGRVSLVSQSGGILGALLSRGAAQGIGLARLVATGNEADIEVAEVLDHLVDDAATGVIALYVEGLRNPAAFARAARRAAAAGKPVVAFKVGRSEAGAQAAISHTGAMAGADRMYDAFFRSLGVIRAERFSDLLDIPAALAGGRRAAGFRVAVLTSTGGAGALVADAVGLAGGALPPLAPDAAARIGALTGEASAANPVDVTLAGLRPDLFRGAIGALLDSPAHDALVVVVGSSALAQPSLVADAILEARGDNPRPVLAYVSPHAPHIAANLMRRGVPASVTPEGIAAMLAALARPAPRPAEPGAAAVPADLPLGRLDEAESKTLFARFGIQAVREVSAATPEEAQRLAAGLGPRLVVKIRARDVAHKSDRGGVALNVAPDAVAATAHRLLAAVPEAEALLVQEQVSGGVEMILGLLRDPQLGAAVLLGAGGTAAEVFGDTALRMLPLSRADAEEMLAGLKVQRLLAGFRGAPPADRAALVDAVLAFARMGEALGERLREAEINPLFVLPAGQGVRAADGLAVLG